MSVDASNNTLPFKDRRVITSKHRRQTDRDMIETIDQNQRFQVLLLEVTKRFANAGVEDLDKEINRALQWAGEFLQVDRAFIIHPDDKPQLIRTHYNWYADDISADPEIEVGMPLEHFSFLLKQTQSGSDIIINQLNDLPTEASTELMYFQDYGIKSFLMMPLYVNAKVIGNLGFAAIKYHKWWDPNLVVKLRFISELIAVSLDRLMQEQMVDNRLRFEQLVARLSATFINLPADEVSDSIQKALGEVSQFIQADFSTFMVCHPQTGELQHTDQWVAPGVRLDTDFTDFDIQQGAPWLAQELSQGKVIIISQLSDFPVQANKERKLFKNLGLKSVLWVPFYVAGKLAGYIVFNAIKEAIQWPEALIQQLKMIGEVFANAVARKHSAQDLNKRLQFESLLASLSTTFINLPNNKIDESIIDALHKVAEYTNCDEAFLFQFKVAPDESGISHGWFRCGESRNLNFDFDQFLETFPWAARQLRLQESIVFGSLDELPAVAKEERSYLQSEGIRSSIVIPLILDKQLLGLLFVQDFNEKQWPAHFVEQIQLAAQIFFNALQRKATEQKLHTALKDINQLKKLLEAENLLLQQEIKTKYQHEDIIGSSPVIKIVLSQAEQVAPLESTVLIMGETGTGKELVANLIHKLSPHADKKMIRVNCAALPAALIEAELFGREKGAYTGALSKQIGRFELANGSTIFLDEIGELPMELQAKLLRVLQEGEFERLGSTQTLKVDVRVITATNRNLLKQVKEGQFREDLYYRLNVFPITVPALRERRMDIPALVWAFVREYGDTMGKSIERIPKTTMQKLQTYNWPGNVRELRNVIERAMILSQNGVLRVELTDTHNASERHTGQTLAEVQANHIQSILEQTAWRIRGEAGAAQILDMNPCTLESRMKKLSIKRPKN